MTGPARSITARAKTSTRLPSRPESASQFQWRWRPGPPARSSGKVAGISLDSAGNLYIADLENNRIRRVDAVTGVISTIAGPDGLYQPGGLVVDAANNVWFSNAWARVAKLAAGSGTVTTVAGGVITGFGGDGGPALNARFWDPVPSAIAPNGDLYIADFENSRIRMLSAKTGIVTSVAGSGACVSPVGFFWFPVCNSGFSGDGGPGS